MFGGVAAAPWQLLEIDDSPEFRHRGLMVDVGRRFMPLPLLQRIVDAMSPPGLRSAASERKAGGMLQHLLPALVCNAPVLYTHTEAPLAGAKSVPIQPKTSQILPTACQSIGK